MRKPKPKSKIKYRLYVDLQLPAKIFFEIMASMNTDNPKLYLLVKDDNKPKSLSEKGIDKLKKIFDSILYKIPAGFFNTEMSARIAKINILTSKGLLAHLQGDKREFRSTKNQIGRQQYKMRLLQDSQAGQETFSYIKACIYFEQVLKMPIKPYDISLEMYIEYQNLSSKTAQRLEANGKRN